MKLVNKKGFTLIELLIVITIIGILAVALLPRLVNAPARARDASRKVTLANIAAVLEAYFSDKGAYPVGATNCFGGSSSDTTLSASLASYVEAGDLPKDPLATGGVGSSCPGGFYYNTLTSNGVKGASYLLVADTEIDGTGVPYSTVAVTSASKLEDVSASLGTAPLGTGTANVYVLAR